MISECTGREKSHGPRSRVSTRLMPSLQPPHTSPHTLVLTDRSPLLRPTLPHPLSLSPWPSPHFCPELYWDIIVI